MKATAQVKNSEDKIIGFVIDGRFVAAEEARANQNVIDNLAEDGDNRLKPVQDPLPVVTLRRINQDRYHEITSQNSLSREIQEQFENWRIHKSDYVLYLSGARQTGKTTEIRKFIYKNYENILYIDLSVDRLRTDLEHCMQGTMNMAFVFAGFCRQNRMVEFVDSPDTVIVLDEIQESVSIYNLIRQMQDGLRCHVIVTGRVIWGKLLIPVISDRQAMYGIWKCCLCHLRNSVMHLDAGSCCFRSACPAGGVQKMIKNYMNFIRSISRSAAIRLWLMNTEKAERKKTVWNF